MSNLTASHKLLVSELVMYRNKYRTFTLADVSADTGYAINTIRKFEDGEFDSFNLISYYYSKLSADMDDEESELMRHDIIDTMRRNTRQMIFNRIDPDGTIQAKLQDIGHNEYQE